MPAPPYALDPILPYLRGVVWECAVGEGSLKKALPTAWFTYGLNIGKQMTFSKIEYRNEKQMQLIPFETNAEVVQ